MVVVGVVVRTREGQSVSRSEYRSGHPVILVVPSNQVDVVSNDCDCGRCEWEWEAACCEPLAGFSVHHLNSSYSPIVSLSPNDHQVFPAVDDKVNLRLVGIGGKRFYHFLLLPSPTRQRRVLV